MLSLFYQNIVFPGTRLVLPNGRNGFSCLDYHMLSFVVVNRYCYFLLGLKKDNTYVFELCYIEVNEKYIKLICCLMYYVVVGDCCSKYLPLLSPRLFCITSIQITCVLFIIHLHMLKFKNSARFQF